MNANKLIKSAALCAALAAASAAHAELAVVVSPTSTAAPMSTEQVSDVFLGKSTTLTPVDQPESAPARGEFYKKVTDKDAPQVKSIWARLIFTGKATPPKEVSNAADVKKAVAANPKAIGYIDKTEVDSSVKEVLSVK